MSFCAFLPKHGAALPGVLQLWVILYLQHCSAPPGPSSQSGAPQYLPQARGQHTNLFSGCGIPPCLWHLNPA